MEFIELVSEMRSILKSLMLLNSSASALFVGQGVIYNHEEWRSIVDRLDGVLGLVLSRISDKSSPVRLISVPTLKADKKATN